MKAIDNLKNALTNGHIIHVAYNGDEFLRYEIDGEYYYSYVGTGSVSDWKDAEGVTFEENGDYPDCVGGISHSDLYVQPNTEVSNPIEFDLDEWEIISETAFRYKRAM